MLLRLVALVAGVGPALVMLLSPGESSTVLAVSLALAASGLVVVAVSRARGLAFTGVLMATLAALVAPGARELLPLTGLGTPIPSVDLEHDAFPDPAPQFVEVRGWFRNRWMLDEYAVADDERPNQSSAAAAVLIPFVGTTEDVVALRGAVVVARVSANQPSTGGATTIRGRVSPLPDELLSALVAVVRPQTPDGQMPAAVSGVIVDTLAVHSEGEAWTRLALLALLAIAASSCLGVASRVVRRTQRDDGLT